MPTLIAGRFVARAILISGIFSATFSLAPSVTAQEVFGPAAGGNNTTGTAAAGTSGGNSTSSGGGASLFYLPNFIGDRRVDDLYVYMHETEKPPWDTYRNYVHGLAGQTVNLQPLRRSPDASTANNNAAANSMIMGAGSAVGQMMGGSQNGGPSADTQGGGNQTNSGGDAPSSESAPPPDTMMPPEATATNYDLPAAGAVTNVSGMVVGPGSELIPGLMP